MKLEGHQTDLGKRLAIKPKSLNSQKRTYYKDMKDVEDSILKLEKVSKETLHLLPYEKTSRLVKSNTLVTRKIRPRDIPEFLLHEQINQG